MTIREQIIRVAFNHQQKNQTLVLLNKLRDKNPKISNKTKNLANNRIKTISKRINNNKISLANPKTPTTKQLKDKVKSIRRETRRIRTREAMLSEEVREKIIKVYFVCLIKITI